MRLFQFERSGDVGVGVFIGDGKFIDVKRCDANLPNNLKELISLSNWRACLNDAAHKGPVELISTVNFLPPILNPNAVWALALNFKTHIDETGLQTSPHYPHVFMRHMGSLVGHQQSLIAPPETIGRAFDYEGELCVIVGKGGRHIPVEKALNHVAGFTCCNEGSVREFQAHNRQFGLGKNFEKSGSIGPYLVTPDEISDYKNCEIITRLNGVVRQQSKLSDMLFSVEKVINYLSKGYELRVGDIIMMGTPGALPPSSEDDIGADLSKQFGRIKVRGLVHMRPGDLCEVEISSIGVLSNPIVADEDEAYRVVESDICKAE